MKILKERSESSKLLLTVRMVADNGMSCTEGSNLGGTPSDVRSRPILHFNSHSPLSVTIKAFDAIHFAMSGYEASFIHL